MQRSYHETYFKSFVLDFVPKSDAAPPVTEDSDDTLDHPFSADKLKSGVSSFLKKSAEMVMLHYSRSHF